MPTKKIAKTHRVAVRKQTSREAVEHVTTEQPDVIPLRLYKRIALTFIFFVAIALMAVTYLSTMQAVIRVVTVPTEITTDFIVRTVETATTDGEVQGEIHSGTLGKTKTVTLSSGTQKEVAEQAVGTVTISNTTNTPQPLIATTRLLTANGVLFRLKNSVTVPAKGSIDALVFADQKGLSGNIPPSSFTIPGLNEVKQSLIVAKNTNAFTGGVKQISVLTKEEMEKAVEALKQELTEDAKEMLRAQRKVSYQGEAFFVDVKDQKMSAKVGDEVNTFDLSLTASVSGVFYDEAALKKITTRKLYEGLSQGKEFIDEGEQSREIRVEQVNAGQNSASIHVIQKGKVMTSRTHKALEVGQFVGMTEGEVQASLLEQHMATSVEVDFFPFWVRTIPRLKDHIYIEIR